MKKAKDTSKPSEPFDVEKWFRGKFSWASTALAVWEDYLHTEMYVHAGNIAFALLSASIPFIIMVSCLVSLFGISEESVIKAACLIVPEALGPFVSLVVSEAYSRAGLTFTISVIALFWTSSRGIAAFMNGLNGAYGVKEDRAPIWVTSISLLGVIVLLLLFVLPLWLIFGTEFFKWLSSYIPSVASPDDSYNMLTSVCQFFLSVFTINLCYTLLPAGKRKYNDQLPGAILAAVAWFVFTLFFRLYVSMGRGYDFFYGSLGTIFLFQFWLYWNVLFLLYGAFLNRFLQERTRFGGKQKTEGNEA